MDTPNGAIIEYVNTEQKLKRAILEIKTWPIVGLDTETALLVPARWENDKLIKDRLDFHRMALRSIQLGNEDVVYVIDCACVNPEPLRSILEGPQLKVAHFQKFEYKILRMSGFEVSSMACTMRAEQVINQGLLIKPPSLADLALQYLEIEMDKTVRDTFVEERVVKPLSEEQILYSASDVDILIPIYKNQEQQLKAVTLAHGRTLFDIAEFEWKMQRAFARIELRGFRLSPDEWMVRVRDSEQRRDQALGGLKDLFRPAAMKRWDILCNEREVKRGQLLFEIEAKKASGEDYTELQEQLQKLPSWLRVRPLKGQTTREPKKTALWDFDKVLSSPKQLLESFKYLGLNLPDTNERTLKRYARLEIPSEAKNGIDLLLSYRKIEKQCTSYSENWLTMISPVTGRLHAEYDELKDTARTGCSSPNIQQVPKRKEGKVYRKCFHPDEGNVFIVSDYSQIELRVAAELSGDENMIAAFNRGDDLHAATAAQMFHCDISQVTPDQRTSAKCVNFGIPFGIGPQKLSEQITNETGQEVTKETGQRLLQLHSKAYPKLNRWLARTGEEARNELVSYTVLGHRRRYALPVKPTRQSHPNVDEFYQALDEYRGRLAGIEREGKNTPIQGTACEIAKCAILKLEEVLPKWNAGIVAFIHDEIVVEAPEVVAYQVRDLVRKTMEDAAKPFMRLVPCVAEASLGFNWLCDDWEDA